MNARVLFFVATALFALTAATPVLQTPAPSPGDVSFAQGDFDDAFASYEQTLQALPNDVDANIGAARIEIYQNDLASAQANLQTALQADSQNGRARQLEAAIVERRDGGGTYRISFPGSEVDVPFLQTDPLPIVEATIDGHNARLIIDTGAPGIDLTADFAKTAGVASAVAGQDVFAGGKTAQVRDGSIDSVTIGGVRVRNVPTDILGSLQGVDGFLGTGFLYRFLATIDYVHGRLILRPKSATTAFEQAARASGATFVPMLLVPDHFIFAHASVSGGASELFNIDTGGGGLGIQLTKAALEAAQIVPDAAHASSFRGGGGVVRVIPFTAGVAMGKTTVKALPGLYFPDGDQYGIFPFTVSGTLSHLFFRHTQLTLDFSGMYLILS